MNNIYNELFEKLLTMPFTGKIETSKETLTYMPNRELTNFEIYGPASGKTYIELTKNKVSGVVTAKVYNNPNEIYPNGYSITYKTMLGQKPSMSYINKDYKNYTLGFINEDTFQISIKDGLCDSKDIFLKDKEVTRKINDDMRISLDIETGKRTIRIKNKIDEEKGDIVIPIAKDEKISNAISKYNLILKGAQKGLGKAFDLIPSKGVSSGLKALLNTTNALKIDIDNVKINNDFKELEEAVKIYNNSLKILNEDYVPEIVLEVAKALNIGKTENKEHVYKKRYKLKNIKTKSED